MKYEWAIVGGGISGIVLAEILTREGHSVLLIDKGTQLAGETTKKFHEWIHTGALYTLIPDRLVTLKYLLGSIDDLLEYYSSFDRMNAVPTESGLQIDGNSGWFAPNYVNFKYKVHRFNPIWTFIMARSMFLVEKIGEHDWLRRRGGVIENFLAGRHKEITRNIFKTLTSSERFIRKETTDFTTNSRNILRDLIATAMYNGLELSLGNEVKKIERTAGNNSLVTQKGEFEAKNVVICAGENIPDFMDVKVKNSYAPIAVARGFPKEAYSFVELDYYTKNCINLITKENGYGLIGGISLDDEDQATEYLKVVIKKHKKLYPGLEIVGSYMGLKNEIVFEKQSRNYLFHIVPVEEGQWAVVPGKFTLGFSLAPEFYRQVYGKNPRKKFQTCNDNGEHTNFVSDTYWYDLAKKREV